MHAARLNEVLAAMRARRWWVTCRGFILVKNYSCLAYETAQRSSTHARALSFDREMKRVIEISWDQAVNDTANLWAVNLPAGPRAGAAIAAVRGSGAGQGDRKWIRLVISRACFSGESGRMTRSGLAASRGRKLRAERIIQPTMRPCL